MRLTQFGAYALPQNNKQDQIDTGSLAGNQVALIDGQAYDHYGAGVAPEAPATYRVRYEIVASAASTVQTARDAIRALAGARAKLYAQMPDASTRWTWARLTHVGMDRQPDYVCYQPVELTFQVARPGWSGTDRSATWTPAASPLNMTASNNGNRMVRDATLTVLAGATAISNIRLVCGSCDWTYGGTVAAGKSLVIDCAARSVVNNGIDDYKQLALNAGHTVADWLQLPAAHNPIVVTYSGNAGGDAKFTLVYFDGWY